MDAALTRTRPRPVRLRRAWRRAAHLGASVVAMVAIVAGIEVYGLRLHPTAALSGWLLAASVAVLASFGARKKLSTIPLGRASTWLRLHIDIGIVSLAMFAVHACYNADAGWHVPNGWLEQALAAAYLATVASGISA